MSKASFLKRQSRVAACAILAVAASLTVTGPFAGAHPPSDKLHGGQGKGVKVVGHLGIGPLNGHVAVLGNYAYVGFGTNGGFASQWNKTPTCKDAGAQPGNVKVVSLANPANPQVVSEIAVGDPSAPAATIARDVAAIHVNAILPASPVARDLLAVTLEACNGGDGLVGVNFYDVTNPATPILLSQDSRFVGNVATRQVSLVQRPDGRVFALEANQGGLSGAINVVDVTSPATPVTVGSFGEQANGASSTQECRPYSFAQGVSANGAGSKAYAAYQDQGLFVLNTSNPLPGSDLPTLGQASYPASQEGNSFRFVPNAGETTAVATDEDLLPAKTTLTIASGSAAGSYRGCEAIWGSPLYERATPSLDAGVVHVGGGGPGETGGSRGCDPTDYAGTDAAGKIVVVFRGTCDFDTKARRAQAAGAGAVLIADTRTDHGIGGTGVLFSPDSTQSGDAGVTIPVAMTTKEAGNAISDATKTETVTGTLADTADTWGALRVFDLSGSNPTQVATFNAPNTTTLTPGDGLYHAVNAVWSDKNVFAAFMSDGFRTVDLSTPSSPQGRAFYVPPAASDSTGNYGSVPLVVGVAKFGSRVVITDINGGLYVLDVLTSKDQCKNGGWQNYAGINTQGECNTFLGF